MNENDTNQGLTRFLSTRELVAALGEILPRAPCRRTLRKWGRAGLPYIPKPGSPQRLYVLSEVVAWLSRRTLRRDVHQQAVDKTFLQKTHPPRRVA